MSTTVNAHDALVAALREYVEDHALAERQEQAAMTGQPAHRLAQCPCAICERARAALRLAGLREHAGTWITPEEDRRISADGP